MDDVQVVLHEFCPRTVCSLGPLGAALGIAGAGIVGSLIDAETSRSSAADQRAFNEYQYRRRYQWQMEDMREAGLNPILSYKMGAPSGPGVGGYQSNFAGALASSVNSGIAAARMRAEIDNIKADTALKEEQSTVATTQHQMNDIIARGHVMQNALIAPDAYAANEVMELIRQGGRTGDTLAMINRIRQMLGLGLIGGRGR